MASDPGFRISQIRPTLVHPSRLGVPTEYAGTTFRSRLEAQWACFFDSAKWRWRYEPTDLFGYIPDFVITFQRAPLLVEVKPEYDIDGLRPYAEKVCRSGWRGDFLMVGAGPLWVRSESVASLGLLALWDRESDDGWQSEDHAIAIDCNQCGKLSFRHASAEWFCINCRASNHRVHFESSDPQRVDERWSHAVNATQWKASQ